MNSLTKCFSLRALFYAVAILLMATASLEAACAGTVYFKAPATWTKIYVTYEQKVTDFTSAKNATTGYYEIDLSKAAAQGWGRTEFFLTSTSSPSSTAQIVSPAKYDVTGDTYGNVAGQGFTCPGTGEQLYVTEDGVNPGSTYSGKAPPNAKFFYFLPPDDEDWGQGVPQVVIDGGAPQYMRVDGTDGRCGWYTLAFENAPKNVLIVLDSDPTNTIGAGGLGEENPVPFDLDAQFTALNSNEIYFEADAGPEGWKSVYQGGSNSCGYDLAAFIYDTDASLHPSFSCWSEGGEGCQYGAGGLDQTEAQTYVKQCIGVKPGIVEELLGSDNKPVLSSKGNGPKCFESAKYFDQMFNQTDGVNEKVCYDLPFARSLDGKWEFNSDFHSNLNGNDEAVIGGFYPTEHTTNTDVISGNPEPKARTKRGAEGPVFVGPYLREVENKTENASRMDLFCNGPGWTGGNDCENKFNAGADLDALVPAGTCVWGWSCDDAGNRPKGWPTFKKGTETPVASTSADATSRWTSNTLGRNQHFCFESHAKFKYTPGQRFSFRGDDDIWVFIGGKLAVDLGGTHLAAPGYVDLGAITDKNNKALVVGNEYPIDIFFCDRRTTMSNVRIKTNIFFSQKSGLFAEAVDSTQSKMCMMAGSTNSCEAVLSPQGVDQIKCGADLDGLLEYYLTNRMGDTLWLDAARNEACKEEGANLKCYSGIVLNSGFVTVDKSKVNGLAGTYIVWARVKEGVTSNPPPPTRIKKFTTATNVTVIAGLADYNGAILDLTPAKNGVVAGKRIPVYFASGALGDNGNVVVNTDPDVAGTTFTLNATAGNLSDAVKNAELLLYTSATGGEAVPATTQFTIPASGLCTLWVAGTYRASEDYTYTVNVSGAKSPPAKLEVRLPLLKFMDETFATEVPAVGTGLRDAAGKILPIMMGTEIKLYLLAYDPAAPDQVCESCNFTLSGSSDVPDTTIPRAVEFIGLKQTEKEGVFVGGMVGGKASISISGSEPVKDPYWAFATIRGLSEKTLAKWDSLRFKEPPVPYPLYSGMYDKNGDGKGDSLFIAYNRVLPGDSLPDFVEIWWPESATDSLYLSKSELAAYWSEGDSVIVIDDRDFSTAILTAGVGRLRNTATYKDPDQGGKEVTTGFNKSIVDRLGPVIAQASYSGKDKGCGTDATSACTDKIILKFSESVEISAADSVTFASELGNLFNFRLIDYPTEGWRSDLPAYKMSVNDSTATLIYQRYDGAVTPQALDSVKFRGDSVDLRLLRDLEGNFPSNRQIGAKIEGVKPLKIHKVIIGDLNVNDPAIRERLKGPAVTVHAIPPGTSMDSIPYMYPGTVGQVIMVDVPGKLFMLSQGGSGTVKPENVKFVLGSQYFSNLGSFVAKNDFVILCTDEMFKGNCIENPAYLYVAWNMITDDQRFAGSGAYINTLKFFWTAYVNNATLKFDNVDPDAGEPYIMGVRRNNGLVGQK